NKRLDEWVTPERLDLKKIQFPKKEAKTPTKNGLPGSRPSSPERDLVMTLINVSRERERDIKDTECKKMERERCYVRRTERGVSEARRSL
ncbi:hypothetical protein chiPu_0027377, partial [Chiloscyllium punctatum]|nr:hypothetical protein [Chiloscyllium punctatum]